MLTNRQVGCKQQRLSAVRFWRLPKYHKVHYGVGQVILKEIHHFMTFSAELQPLLQGLNIGDYDIDNLDDEIRVDKLCVNLLRRLYQDLVKQGGISPQRAGEACHGADYFLREFVIADRRKNLFVVEASLILQFAGHWYIIRAPEPSLKELTGILCGTADFYRFLFRQQLITEEQVSGIVSQCQEFDYYQRRIEAFWAIEGDGYDTWRQACPLVTAQDQP